MANGVLKVKVGSTYVPIIGPGAEVLVQPGEPVGFPDGHLWYDSDEPSLSVVPVAWTAYTPTLTGFTAGNATLTGGYTLIGKTVDFWARCVFGSTSVYTSGPPALSLPVPARLVATVGALRAVLTSAGFNAYQAFPLMGGTTSVQVYALGTLGAASMLSSTNPFTWKSTDIIEVGGTYEAA